MADLDTEDSSFVILGHGSLPVLENDGSYKEPTLNSMTNSKGPFSSYESTNTSINIGQRLTGDILSEENIQKKLSELVKENYQLKETLSQNNLAIKSQLDTFFMWQQEVLKTHETHKQKFLETKDLILKLRAENSAMKKQLEDSSKEDDEIYAEVNKKPQEVNKLKETVEKYEKICDDFRKENENLNIKILNLNEELQAGKKEILKLNNELEDLGRDNAHLKQENDDFNKNSLESMSHRSLPNSEARAQISNLLKQLDEEKSKGLKLKEELRKIKVSNGKMADSKLSTTEELHKYIDNLNDMDVSLDMQNQRFSSLQSWVTLAEESIKENKIHTGVECNLMCEINELKSHLNQEENVSREKHEALQELKKKFTVLLEDYKVLQLKLNAINNRDTNIEEYKEEISSLSAKLEAKENELRSKEQECDSLKQEIGKLNVICEEVDLLKIQVQVYESDFKEERAAREKLVNEKEHMSEQLRGLQSKIDETEQGNPKEKNESPLACLRNHQGEVRFMCPKCNFTFCNLDTCMEHIDDCLNIHFYPN